MSDIEPYRLAYNVFHRNLSRFGIPVEDIPPPKTEVVPEMDSFMQNFSISAVFYQISLRSVIKPILDNEFLTVHNLNDFYTRFTGVMQRVLSEDLEESDGIEGLPEEPSSENASRTMEESTKANPSQKAGKNVTTDAMKDDLVFPGFNLGNLLDTPGLIALSLAVCTELILYEKENENNKAFLKDLPDMWEKYFNDVLNPHCEGDGYNLERLKKFSDDVYFPETFLNKFVSENKNEYCDIVSKWDAFIKPNAELLISPTSSSDSIEEVSLSKQLRFSEIRKKFQEVKEIAKRWRSDPPSQNNGSSIDQSELTPLLNDYSPSSPSSPQAEASGRRNYGYEEC